MTKAEQIKLLREALIAVSGRCTPEMQIVVDKALAATEAAPTLSDNSCVFCGKDHGNLPCPHMLASACAPVAIVGKTAEQLADNIFEILAHHRPHYTPHSPSTYQEILNLIAQELPDESTPVASGQNADWEKLIQFIYDSGMKEKDDLTDARFECDEIIDRLRNAARARQ